MIGNSVIKIQYAMTLKDYNSNNWLTIMIVSVLTLACGILFVFNPFKGATLLTQTLGIALFAYAVVDIVNSCILKKNMKKFSKQVKEEIKEFKEAVYEEVEEEEAPKKKTQTKKKTTSKKTTSTKKKSTSKKATSTKKKNNDKKD